MILKTNKQVHRHRHRRHHHYSPRHCRSTYQYSRSPPRCSPLRHRPPTHRHLDPFRLRHRFPSPYLYPGPLPPLPLRSRQLLRLLLHSLARHPPLLSYLEINYQVDIFKKLRNLNFNTFANVSKSI